MTEVEYLNLAKSLLRENNLTGWRPILLNSFRRAGVCKYRTKEIGVSKKFLEYLTFAEVKDIILHEIAHAIAGYAAGHGPLWKKVCIKIGARPERLLSLESLTNEKAVIENVMTQKKYVGTCPCCNSKVYFSRMPKLNKSCAKCSPVYDVRYKFIISVNK